MVVEVKAIRGAGGRWWIAMVLVAALLAVACSSSPRGPARTAPEPAEPVETASRSTEAATPSAPPPVVIESIDLREGAPGMLVDMDASGPLVWTSYRDAEGNLVVELPNSTPSPSLASQMPGSGLVSSLSMERETGGTRPLTRLVVRTNKDFEHSVTADGNALRLELAPLTLTADSGVGVDAEPASGVPTPADDIEPYAYEPVNGNGDEADEMADAGDTVPGRSTAEMPAETAAAIPPAPASMGTADAPYEAPAPTGRRATRLTGVKVMADGSVLVSGNGEFDYSTFRLQDPERFVIDLDGVVNNAERGTVDVGGQNVERVRMAQFRSNPAPVSRVVFDLSGTTRPIIDRTAEGLMVRFGPAVSASVAATAPAPAEPVMADSGPMAAEAGDEPMMDEPDMDEPTGAVASAPVMDTAVVEPEPTMVAQAEPPADEPAYDDDPMDDEPAYDEPAYDDPMDDEPTMVAPVPAAPSRAEAELAARAAEPDTSLDGASVTPATTPSTPRRATSDVGLYAASQAALEEREETDLGDPGERTFTTKVFGARTVGGTERSYYGEPISMSLRDADVVETLRSFAAISGLSIVVQPEVSGSVTVELDNVPWDQALEQILRINRLGYELEGTVMRIAPVGVLKEEAEEQQQLAAAKALQVPLKTIMRRLSYATAGEVAELLTSEGGLLSQRGSVIIDERTNTLILQELPAFMDTIVAVVDEIDTPEPQVMIEARIIETTKRFTRSLGVDWSVAGEASARLGNTTGLVFPNNVTGEGGVNLVTGADNGFLNLSLGNVLNSFQLDVALQAAETEGLIKIISAPKVAVLNNQPANIQSGLQIPVQTVSNNTVTVQFVNATLSFDVTPHVTAEGTVLMDIFIRKREPQLAFALVGATNAPIATKEARTRVIVRDGGTTVIGGIYEVSSDQGTDRVPGLSNVPIIGHLFKNQRRTDENEELLIFITPRVINL